MFSSQKGSKTVNSRQHHIGIQRGSKQINEYNEARKI